MNITSLHQLVEQSRAGDDAAADRLFQSMEPYLRVVVRRHLSPALRTQLDSIDVVQSVWLHVLQSMDRANWAFDDEEYLRAFFAKAIRNRLVDHSRRIQASRERERHAANQNQRREGCQPRPSQLAQAGELWERMVALCPPQHRELLELKRQGLTLEEIAKRVELHPSSVRRILYDLARQLALRSNPPTPN